MRACQGKQGAREMITVSQLGYTALTKQPKKDVEQHAVCLQSESELG